ncbi:MULTISPECIES: lysozyme inhibitor LprI family protein [Halomonadaceae]|uniref:DUF1311 domain-containing protein n=1 Tax=Vreelandella halophila TaxID=86177 RepID=A0A9X5B4E7_9GAMM|nr:MULTISPECIES: lysozyme inhibitor LprI family protein [Halomonas]MYL26290.1 DUF1311 domain-containing protein [Halomonas utahensis]MYL73627.1 DUF1311 domain-containing protein [Halomonas sp. 22501_18_FS]
MTGIGSLLKHQVAVLLLAIMVPMFAYGLDNPDKPDLVASFQSRAEPYKERIRNKSETTQQYRKAYSDYRVFLEKELESSYQKLIQALPDSRTKSFKRSQKQWAAFQDSEFRFIDDNWSHTSFGSSSVISRGGYKTQVLENRIILILQYLQNY